MVWSRYGGEIWDWQILLGSFMIYGAYVIYSTLKRGFYLDVVTRNDHRKLEFGIDVEKDMLDPFVNDASKLLGRNIEMAPD